MRFVLSGVTRKGLPYPLVTECFGRQSRRHLHKAGRFVNQIEGLRRPN